MPLRLVVSMQPVPGKRQEMIEAYTSFCPEVQQEPGCQQFEMYQNIAFPDQFVLLERWADQEALTAHSHLTKDHRAAMAFLRTVVGETERYTG